MKTLINILILLIFNVNLVFGYQMYSTMQQNHSRIGYTTNYSNGNFTPSAYQNRTMQYQSTYRIGYTTGYSNGVFTPNTYGSTNTGGSYRPGGQPRKIKVYDGNGNENNTPGGNSDPEGVYQYDKSTGIWYYSPDGGVTWYEWRSKGFWEAIGGVLFDGDWSWGTTWRSVNHQQTENTTNWATDPNDPFLQPIGDGTIPLSLLMLVYLSYNQYRKKQRHCKH